MKKWFLLMAIAALSLVSCNEKVNVIRTDVPHRPAGQESVLGLKAEPIETVRIGVVGLGMRGASAVDRLSYVPDSKVTAICDIEQDRVDNTLARLQAKGMNDVHTFGGEAESWRGLCESPDVDLVYICTDWKTHTPIALYAMEVYLSPEHAEEVIAISKSFGIDAQIVGRVEGCDHKELIIRSEFGEFVY